MKQDENREWLAALVMSGAVILAGVLSNLIFKDEPAPEDPEYEKRMAEYQKKRLSGKVIRRARFRCENCGQRGRLIVSYIVSPLEEEGEGAYDLDNLQALCQRCDNERNDSTPSKPSSDLSQEA